MQQNLMLSITMTNDFCCAFFSRVAWVQAVKAEWVFLDLQVSSSYIKFAELLVLTYIMLLFPRGHFVLTFFVALDAFFPALRLWFPERPGCWLLMFFFLLKLMLAWNDFWLFLRSLGLCWLLELLYTLAENWFLCELLDTVGFFLRMFPWNPLLLLFCGLVSCNCSQAQECRSIHSKNVNIPGFWISLSMVCSLHFILSEFGSVSRANFSR